MFLNSCYTCTRGVKNLTFQNSYTRIRWSTLERTICFKPIYPQNMSINNLQLLVITHYIENLNEYLVLIIYFLFANMKLRAFRKLTTLIALVVQFLLFHFLCLALTVFLTMYSDIWSILSSVDKNLKNSTYIHYPYD